MIPSNSKPPVEVRLECLERSQSRLRAATLLLSALVLALLSWQFLSGTPVVEAERLVIRDARHRSRAEMLTLPDGTVMARLNGENEKARSLWRLEPDGAIGLRLADAAGVTRAELRLEADGEPSLVLAGPDGRTRTRVGVAGDATRPALLVRDAAGQVRGQVP